MIATTQQLAIRINLARKQFVTTTHDVAFAWSGLGAAVMSLWRQHTLAASVWQVLTITVYLGSIAILHITIPTLVSGLHLMLHHPQTSDTLTSSCSSIQVPN